MVSGKFLADLEKKLGLPKLSQVADTLQRFPDSKQLKLIKDVMTMAERVSQSAPELETVITLIREINAMPADRLKDLEKVLRRIEKITKSAPQDLLAFLGSLKEE